MACMKHDYKGSEREAWAQNREVWVVQGSKKLNVRQGCKRKVAKSALKCVGKRWLYNRASFLASVKTQNWQHIGFAKQKKSKATYIEWYVHRLNESATNRYYTYHD